MRISDELREFIESGLSVVIATRDGKLCPNGTVAWAAAVHDDREHLTIFLHDKASREMLKNLKSHPEIAIDLDRPTSHRACQVKGLFVKSRRARPSERAIVKRQVQSFEADLEAIGLPRKATSGWQSWPCSALEVRVTELFEQTPGPGTGGPLR